MPHFCSAFGCTNERSVKTKQKGITFHSFPKNTDRRRAWVAAVRRKDFVPSDSSVICSCHFRPEDFDRTGQTVRLRDGVTPSVFNFPEYLCKVPSTSRSTRTSQAALQSPDVQVQPPDNQEESTSDHQYALDLIDVKRKLTEAQERVDELQRKLRNARDRERRHTKTVKSLLQDLKEKKLLTEELQHTSSRTSQSSSRTSKSCCMTPKTSSRTHKTFSRTSKTSSRTSNTSSRTSKSSSRTSKHPLGTLKLSHVL
ncbi:THAP domain-containing protein 6-like [Epinephelus moara]|uniref:THAP domain-containing protein 6-like n=1 Tax=Epinephelus moara TaxID=300413 RepID=UPI00214F48C5|nr:THAP domain-containing protein 6-like [Epinephelus moara]